MFMPSERPQGERRLLADMILDKLREKQAKGSADAIGQGGLADALMDDDEGESKARRGATRSEKEKTLTSEGANNYSVSSSTCLLCARVC